MLIEVPPATNGPLCQKKFMTAKTKNSLIFEKPSLEGVFLMSFLPFNNYATFLKLDQSH